MKMKSSPKGSLSSEELFPPDGRYNHNPLQISLTNLTRGLTRS